MHAMTRPRRREWPSNCLSPGDQLLVDQLTQYGYKLNRLPGGGYEAYQHEATGQRARDISVNWRRHRRWPVRPTVAQAVGLVLQHAKRGILYDPHRHAAAMARLGLSGPGCATCGWYWHEVEFPTCATCANAGWPD